MRSAARQHTESREVLDNNKNSKSFIQRHLLLALDLFSPAESLQGDGSRTDAITFHTDVRFVRALWPGFFLQCSRYCGNCSKFVDVLMSVKRTNYTQ